MTSLIDPQVPLPVRTIRMRGSDFDAGVRYGEQARAEIRASIARYAEIFAEAGLGDWPGAVAAAERYRAPIAEHAPGSLEQMLGIARGAGLEPGDVLALNARSELMFGVSTGRYPDDGCTSVAVLPERAGSGHTLLGQNWDWTVRARESLVLLAREDDELPGYLALVEAGLLAKTGVNTAGVGLCTNTLVSVGDDGSCDGVPYHVLLHRLQQVPRVSDGLQLLYDTPRALSANYLLAHADGTALDVETGPGGPDGVAVLTGATGGVITHTNHFQDSRLALGDRRVRQSAHTIVRLDRIRRRLAEAGAKICAEDVLGCLTDHANHPLSVCLHPDERRPLTARFATLATVLYDLTTAQVWLSAENPCAGRFTGLDVSELLAVHTDPSGDRPGSPLPPPTPSR